MFASSINLFLLKLFLLKKIFLIWVKFTDYLNLMIGIQNLLNWGGRIRTYEWRSQSPQPYRLATPQKITQLKVNSSLNSFYWARRDSNP